MFGKYTKHILALTALAWITYTMPNVRAALESSYAFENNLAAVSTVSSSSRTVTKSVVRAEVVGQPKLTLKLDSNKKESSLQSSFIVKVIGGPKDSYIDVYQPINFVNSTNNSLGEVVKYGRLTPMVKGLTATTDKSVEAYKIPANKTILFSVSASANVKTLFAGSYYSDMKILYAYSSLDANTGYKITIPANKTNSKTIIGEVSPYITSINPNPAIVGKVLTVYGSRLAGARVIIDGVELVCATGTTCVSYSTSGSEMKIDLPSNLVDGGHVLSIKNDTTGASNVVYFESIGGVPMALNISIIDPNGGGNYYMGQSMTVSWTSEGLMKQPEQAIWAGLEFTSGAVCRMGSISSYVNSINLGLVNGYQCPGTTLTLIPGQYKAIVFLENNPEIRDVSDGYITLHETGVTCPPGFVCTGATSLNPSLVSQSVNAVVQDGSNNDVGMFNIKFKVIAVGGDIYLPAGFGPNSSISYKIEKAGVTVNTASTSATVTSSSLLDTTANNNWLVSEGSTETFTVTVSVPMGGQLTAGQYRLIIDGIKWGVGDDSVAESVTTSGLENFKTGYLILN